MSGYVATYGLASNITTLLGRPLTPAEHALAGYLLEQVSREFADRVTDLDARVASGEIREDSVGFAAEQVVSRVLRNPAAYSQMSESSGSMTRSVTIDRSAASGLLYVGQADLAHFLPSAGRADFKIGSTRITPGLA